MTNRIAIIGPKYRVEKSVFKSSHQIMRQSTNNTGNMVFAYAITHQIGLTDNVHGWGSDPLFIKKTTIK